MFKFLFLAVFSLTLITITPVHAVRFHSEGQVREDKILSGEIKLEAARSVSCPKCSHWTWISQDGPVHKQACWKGHEAYIYPVRYSCPDCGYSWSDYRMEKLFTIYNCTDCNALTY
jgi:mannosyltransferase OCH1-like enzyme